MFRIDLRPVAILSLALATALTTAFGLNRLDGRGQARADTPAVSVSRAADGHYWAEAEIDGVPMRLLVDTGASLVTLSRGDARRMGLEAPETAFTTHLTTASGSLPAAPVRLKSVTVGGVRVENVLALIVDAEMPAPLLGMSYLGRLDRFEAGPNGLTFSG